MYSIQLNWLSFSVDMNTVETWMKANAGPYYMGNSSDNALTLWFSQQPDPSISAAIATYWAALTNASPETANYQSKSTRQTAVSTALASAQAKLTALGLTGAEIAALIGH
jgi:hypothetical protein